MSFPNFWDVFSQFACFLAFLVLFVACFGYVLVRGIRRRRLREIAIATFGVGMGLFVFFALTRPLTNVSAFHVCPDDVRSLTITTLYSPRSPPGRSRSIDDPSLIEEFLKTLESATPKGFSGSKFLDGYRVQANLDNGKVLYFSVYQHTSGKRNAYVLVPHLSEDSLLGVNSQAGQFTCKSTYEWLLDLED